MPIARRRRRRRLRPDLEAQVVDAIGRLRDGLLASMEQSKTGRLLRIVLPEPRSRPDEIAVDMFTEMLRTEFPGTPVTIARPDWPPLDPGQDDPDAA